MHGATGASAQHVQQQQQQQQQPLQQPHGSPPKQPSPREFLLACPRGAYTTLCVRRALGGGSGGTLELIDWSTHLERLVRSLRAMHDALGGCYARYYAWLQSAAAPEPAALQQLMAPTIHAALDAAEQAHASAQHFMLIIVLPPASDTPCGLGVHALAHPCGPPGSNACSAVVLGGPRSVPEAKDSGWVAERQPLEQARQGTAAEVEVLLSTEDGRLLEGLLTNLFVVTHAEAAGGVALGAAGTAGGGTACAADGRARSGVDQSSAAGAAAPAVVWTASAAEGAVWGTMRARVLEACRRLGYAVREEGPSMHARHTWREAFLTNSLRMVQPLQRITCDASNVWGHTPWELHLPSAPGPVTVALAAELAHLLPALPASAL